MHKLTFYPLGNADSCRIILANGRRLLFDYADRRDPSNKADLRVDLGKALREELIAAKKTAYDVVAFTHLDDDHICGASEFFRLDHAEKYQTEGRITIHELWVPAAAIIEEGCEDEARIIRAEARHRLRIGKGIRVFSRPEKLQDWLRAENIKMKDRLHLITDAGKVVPGFSKEADGIEFFAHSPFASRLEDGSVLDRNTDALAFQATFVEAGVETKLILSSDLDHVALTQVVEMTKKRGNEKRLEWDVFKLPHHSSYKSLGPEKGETETVPVKEVKLLFETQGQPRGIVISTSKPIPADDTDDQPPHRQAANYYKRILDEKRGQFLVTMEHPSSKAPEPIEIEIDNLKATVKRSFASGVASILSSPAPRAG